MTATVLSGTFSSDGKAWLELGNGTGVRLLVQVVLAVKLCKFCQLYL